MARSDPHKPGGTTKTAATRTTKATPDRTVATEADAWRAAEAMRLCPALLLQHDARVQAAYQVWRVRRDTLGQNHRGTLDAAARQREAMDQLAAILTRKPRVAP